MAKSRMVATVNPRSRAARRANSPSLNTDKSIKETQRASDATPVLAPHRGAGIQKKIRKKQLTHAQKVRHEKGLHRGQAVSDRLTEKVADSKSRVKKRQSRRALWEEVNSASNEEVRKAIKAPGRLDDLDDDDLDEKDTIEPFHGDTEIKVINGVQVPTFATGQSMSLAIGPALTTTSKKPGTFGTAAEPTSTAVNDDVA